MNEFAYSFTNLVCIKTEVHCFHFSVVLPLGKNCDRFHWLISRYNTINNQKYLRQSYSSFLKCFSQTYKFPLLICLRKFSSTTRSFVITLIQAARVFLDNSSCSDGIRKIPTPTCFRLVPQPNMEQFAPGIAKKSMNFNILRFPIGSNNVFYISQHLAACTIWATWPWTISYFATWPGLPNPPLY